MAYQKAIKMVTAIDIDLSYAIDNRFNRNLLREVLPNLTELEYDRIIREKELSYENYLHETKLDKNITKILLKFSKSNQIFLVTNSREERAITTLEYFRLTDKFDNVFSCDLNQTIEINKYENAISSLGISPEDIVVFENERPEIDKAISAGINRSNIITFNP